MTSINPFELYFFILISLTILYSFAITYLKKGLRKTNNLATDHLMTVSIIVSMHNEEKNVSACLDNLLIQDYPKNKFEIIIVNDRSTDNTEKIIREYCKKYPFIRLITIQEIYSEIAPKKNAIDQAIRLSKSDIILLTDADGRPTSKWVKKIISSFTDETGMVIGYAPYKSESAEISLAQRLLSLEYLSHAAVAAASCGIGYPLTCVGTNMAYRKSVYEELGGFGQFKSIHSGDDDLFLQRVREETQWQVRYASDPDCHVPNAPPVNWLQFYQQRIRYASKGFIYPLELTLLLTGFVLYYLSIPVLLILSVWFPVLFPVVVVGVVCKAVVDYMFISRAAENLQDRRNLYFWPLAFVLHVPYVLFFAFITQFKSYEWAGRRG